MTTSLASTALARRRPFRLVWRCATCGTVLAWQEGTRDEGIWWTEFRIAIAVGTFGLAWAVGGGTKATETPWFQPPYSNACPSCGKEGSLGPALACWVPTSHWFWPPSWGKGGWLLRDEFQKMLTGLGDLDGKEVSLVVHSGGKTP